MIQDIAPKKLYNQYDPMKLPDADSLAICVYNNRILCKLEDELVFPTCKMIENIMDHTMQDVAKPIYLFRIDEVEYYLYMDLDVTVNVDTSLEKYRYVDLREVREKNIGPRYQDMALYTAKHLADWYRDTRFCGRCGHKMVHSESERAMVCPECKNTVYPRIMPAVIVGVKNGDNLLLTKYKTGFGHNALVAGFTEIGETLEETVRREVMEETGLKVKNITYYKSQPWGVANDILMGFYCDVDGDTTITRDDSELKYAAWVQREDIILQPNDYSLTNEMMTMFKEGRM